MGGWTLIISGVFELSGHLIDDFSARHVAQRVLRSLRITVARPTATGEVTANVPISHTARDVTSIVVVQWLADPASSTNVPAEE